MQVLNRSFPWKKGAFNKKKTVFTTTLSVTLTKKLIYCFIWSTAYFGAEAQKNESGFKIEGVFGEEQLEFRRGKGTSQVISERTSDIDKELCDCFIKFQKALDRVSWTKFMQILKESSIGCLERTLSANFTWIRVLNCYWTKGRQEV